MADTKNVSVYNELSPEEFNRMMDIGLTQAKSDDSFDLNEVFDELESGLSSK
ncbi:MAG: hypothetical protein IJ819_12275 [Clostridiales bacterium]|nr:hypothetical protein [Clostridiales bacterium]